MATTDIRKEIMKILEEDQKTAGEITRKVLAETGREASKKLRNVSKQMFKPTGRYDNDYNKGWASKSDKGRLTFTSVIYGKSGTYQLAHLLENGHAKRGGGRVEGKAHIKPVEEWATETAYQRVMQELTGKV